MRRGGGEVEVERGRGGESCLAIFLCRIYKTSISRLVSVICDLLKERKREGEGEGGKGGDATNTHGEGYKGA